MIGVVKYAEKSDWWKDLREHMHGYGVLNIYTAIRNILSLEYINY